MTELQSDNRNYTRAQKHQGTEKQPVGFYTDFNTILTNACALCAPPWKKTEIMLRRHENTTGAQKLFFPTESTAVVASNPVF